jgi:tRNA(fMet)-specific endonuclease VapC
MTATHLLDTSVYSQPFKKRPDLVALGRWQALGDSRLAVSVVTEAELRYGFDWKGADDQRRDFEAGLRLRIPVLDLNSAAAVEYGRIRAELRRRGDPVADMDLLIAATALAHGLTVATLNVRDFSKIPGLAYEDWSL